MLVFVFYNTILLMSIRARDKVGDANVMKKGIKTLIFASPASLHSNNLTMEHTLNKALKFFKELKNLRFATKEINPSEFTTIVNEASIIFLIAKRIND
jgi:hypothetical protein